MKSQKISIDGVQIQNLAEAIKTGQASAAQGADQPRRLGRFRPQRAGQGHAGGGRRRQPHPDPSELGRGRTELRGRYARQIRPSSPTVSPSTMPRASQAGATLTALGFDKIEATMKFAGAYQAANKTFVLDDYSIDFAKLGSIGVSAQAGRRRKIRLRRRRSRDIGGDPGLRGSVGPVQNGQRRRARKGGGADGAFEKPDAGRGQGRLEHDRGAGAHAGAEYSSGRRLFRRDCSSSSPTARA